MKKQKPKAKAGAAKAAPAKPLNTKATASKAAKPVAKAAAKPKVAAKPVAKTAAKPVGKASAKPTAKLAAKPVAKAPGKPSGKLSANVKAEPKVSAKPAPKVAGKPAKVAAAKPEVKPTAKPENKPVGKSAAKPPAAAKVPQAKAEPKPIVIEEPDQAEEVVLTDADGRRYCRVKDCDRLAEVDAYCRYHYILLWKNIQTRRHILQEGKLERYIEELTARYPDKFLEILKKDLRSEKDFLAAIQELEIDESAVEAEFDDEESQSDLFEIQRVSDSGGGGARSEEDDRF